jgi:uncharacterized membrane protein YdjX (TVP38/TMEM64 family)
MPTARQIVAIVILAALSGLLWVAWYVAGIGPRELHQKFAGAPALPIALLIGILPIFGVSVGLAYVAAGARFGAGLGLLIVACATALHLVASYWIARSYLKDALHALLQRRDYCVRPVPEQGKVSLALFIALVPGLPYAVRNYLLPLAEVPFRIYFGICFPVYVVRSSVAIFLGELSGNFNWTKASLLGGLFLLKLIVCAHALKRLGRTWHIGAFRRPRLRRSQPDTPRDTSGAERA